MVHPSKVPDALATGGLLELRIETVGLSDPIGEMC